MAEIIYGYIVPAVLGFFGALLIIVYSLGDRDKEREKYWNLPYNLELRSNYIKDKKAAKLEKKMYIKSLPAALIIIFITIMGWIYKQEPKKYHPCEYTNTKCVE